MEVLKKNNLWSHRTNRLKKYEFLLHYRFLTCPYPLFNCLHWHLNLATLSLSLLFCMACCYLHVSSWQFDNFCRCRSSSCMCHTDSLGSSFIIMALTGSGFCLLLYFWHGFSASVALVYHLVIACTILMYEHSFFCEMKIQQCLVSSCQQNFPITFFSK